MRIMDELRAALQSAEPSGGALERKVSEWLNKQGYPLEMYTQRCCRDNGFQSHQSWYYEDAETGQQRETDVFAYSPRVKIDGRGRQFELAFTFECKQSRGKPWVA